ncbi:MAG: hypothetical protein IBX55_00530 [Methyloprofundus sp.]|nr:hypothetical protein [Methyloprofundus sp.]
MKDLDVIDSIRSDLAHQLATIDDMDWDYFIETAECARGLANSLGVNMTPSKSDDVAPDWAKAPSGATHFDPGWKT